MKAHPAQDSKPKLGGLSPRAVAWLVLAGGILIAFLTASVTSNFQARETQTRFDTQADIAFVQLGKRLDDFRNLILGLQGLFIGSGHVDREEFHRYAENLNLKQRLPGLQALSYQRYVRHAEKAVYVERVRHDRSLDPNGYPAFAIRPEGERPEYVVIDYIEPMAPNRSAFGFDAGTQPGNADAIRLARDTGHFQVSEPMQIVQNPGGTPRIVMRAPVYRPQAPTATVAQRREALDGFVVLTVDAHESLGEFFGKLGSAGVRIVIEDSGLAQPNGVTRRIAVFDSGAPAESAPLLTRKNTCEFGGRNWEILYSAYPAWIEAQPGGNTDLLIFLGGSLVSLLLALLYLAQARSRERATRLAERMTHDLRLNQQRLQVVADLSMDWYWEQDAQHRFVSIIGQAHEAAGLDAARVLGKARWELAPDALSAAEWEAHRRHLDAHEPFDLEYVFAAGDGRRRWLKACGAPRFDESGDFLGYHGTGRDITDQVEAQERLREQARLLQTVFEHMNQGISVVDKDLRLAGHNRRFLELLDFPDSLVREGTTFEDFIRYNAERGEYGPGDVETLVRARTELARRFEPHRFRRTRPDGKVLEIVGAPLPEGGFVTTYTDVTEQESFARKLQSEHDFSQHLIESIPGVFYLISPQGRFLLWNHNFEKVTGYTTEEMAAASPLDFFEGEDRQRVADRIAEVFTKGTASVEAQFVVKDGGRFPYYFTGERLILADGSPGLVGVGLDISEQKQAEDALARQTNILKATLEAMDQGISVVDENLTMSALNRRFCELLDIPDGLARQGATFADFARFNAERGEYGPCDVEAKVAEMVERARHPQAHLFRRTRPNGRIIEVRGNPMQGGGFVTTYTDVTEQEHAQQALRLSEQRYRNLIDLSPDAIFVHRKRLILIANPAAATLWGVGRIEEAIGHDLLDFIHSDSRELVKERIARIESDPALFRLPWIEQEYLRPDGTVIPVEGSATVIQLEDGPAVLSVIRDISSRKAAENAVRELNVTLERRVRERTAELEASNQELESFSYSVSHDLRAPLRALNGFSHLLKEEYAHRIDANGLNYLERIRAASKRMGELIDNLLDLARVSRQDLKRVHVDLSALAGEIREALKEQAPERKVAWHIDPGLAVRADPVLAKALLENLLRNAWKFTAECEEARIEFSATAHDGETVYCVRDNGAGFEMAYADKLFKPFQRLHDAKRFEGTGIGLAIVHRVLRRHGGRIWAEGVPGRGAAFFFTLP
jgi:PAS domain S-box-containing protein